VITPVSVTNAAAIHAARRENHASVVTNTQPTASAPNPICSVRTQLNESAIASAADRK
jgi:hypothetical protein